MLLVTGGGDQVRPAAFTGELRLQLVFLISKTNPKWQHCILLSLSFLWQFFGPTLLTHWKMCHHATIV
jgi:hypothetical protein